MADRHEQGRPPWLPFVAVLLLAACSPEPERNVVLVTFDTTRSDRFGCTGDALAHTPAVDALAARGLLFERSYASVPLTLPSHTTMMTGLAPVAHGVRNNGRFHVPESLDTLAERLHARGYATAAFVSAFVLDPRYGLDQGFDLYSAETHGSSDPLDLTVAQRPGAEVTDEALRWLEARDPEVPFFLWAHYYDVHEPRTVEPPFDQLPDSYRAAVAYADAQLERLLAGVTKAAARRPTLIVFTADHGESLGQHGETTHGLLAYDSTLHVPLILAGPGVPRGQRSRVYARHVDLLPTILTALGVPVPPGLPGRDLLRVFDDAHPDDDPQAGLFENEGPHVDLGWAPITGLRTARWKYTASPAPAELYDILADPEETTNLAAAQPERAHEMAAQFDALATSEARPASGDAHRDPDPEEAAQLAALGYVEAAPQSGGDAPDPRRFVVVWSWVGMGRSLALRGNYDRAIEVLETLAESHSVRGLVLRTLAPVYEQAGRSDDAIRAYREYIEYTGALGARLELAMMLLRAGRGPEALATLDEIEPRTARVSLRRARVLASLGRMAEARREIDTALPAPPQQRARRRARAVLVRQLAPVADGESELRRLAAADPEDMRIANDLGFYLATWGGDEKREEGIALLRKAAEAEPEEAGMLSDLGWALHGAGQDAEARDLLQRALALDGSRQLDRVHLGQVLFDLGESQEALRLVRQALLLRPAASWSDEARSLAGKIEASVSQSPAAGARS